MIRATRLPATREASRCISGWRARALRQPQSYPSRQVHEPARQPAHSRERAPSPRSVPSNPFEIFKESLQVANAAYWGLFKAGKTVTVNGFLGKRRDNGPNLSFVDIQLSAKFRGTLQIVSTWEEKGSPSHQVHLNLKKIPAHSSVSVTGTLRRVPHPKSELSVIGSEDPDSPPLDPSKVPDLDTTPEWNIKTPHWKKYELVLESIQCLNTFSKDIIVSKDIAWPPKSRHLQTRYDPILFERLCFRDFVQQRLGKRLRERSFVGVETPILFKSTPEGAREFLVPTRRKGLAYALPQSPQQYKQLLMSAGIPKYFQFAKCFRDEDHRADRQPEFTQLDLEMAYATGEKVKRVVSYLMNHLFETLHNEYRRALVDGTLDNGTWHPVPKEFAPATSIPFPKMDEVDFSRSITYENAMRQYGIDKPDLRITTEEASLIMPVGHLLSDDFKRMITGLEDPIIEACKFRFSDADEINVREFVREFFDALPNTTHKLSGDSTPGVFIFNTGAPLAGLSALGHEAAEKLAEFEEDNSWALCEDNDVIIIHARKNEPFHGGSTELGRLRKLIYDHAVEKGLLQKKRSFNFVWVERFPMFSPLDGDPGQGGSAGIKATHHPFTAPLTAEDVDLLDTDPLKAVADHYDLVLNGVEIGGGSRRIHVAEVQEYVMRNVLQMTDEGINQFSHLLDALKAGCPPHAGFALGFDRFMAILCDVPSVRDVIAFPKTNKGEDPLVGSPSKTTLAQQKTYHLFVDPKLEA